MILSEFIYGSMDGVITTVAIIAGIIGSDISPKYALVLGLASLFADGFSMGISRYNSLVDVSWMYEVNPVVSGIATFASFVLIGGIPLIPFLFLSFQNEKLIKKMMIVFSVIALLFIGIIKGIYTKKFLKSVSEVLLIGMVGVAISYNVSKYVKNQMVNYSFKSQMLF